MDAVSRLRPASAAPSPPALRPAHREAAVPLPEDSLTLAAPAEPAVEAAAPSAPPPPAPAPEPPTPVEVEGFMLAGSSPSPVGETVLPAPPPPSDGQAVADWCFAVAKSGLPLEERTEIVAAMLAPAVEAAAKPDPSWTKATPEQLLLFAQETLEHTDALERVGRIRGFDWGQHDFEGPTSKFHPEVAQFLAKPGRDESVQWAVQRHNAAPHHALWADPSSTKEDLRESASDIVNAWRMNRRVYDKPSWSWERIERTIQVDDRLSPAQRAALLEAIPAQREEERRNGLPG